MKKRLLPFSFLLLITVFLAVWQQNPVLLPGGEVYCNQLGLERCRAWLVNGEPFLYYGRGMNVGMNMGKGECDTIIWLSCGPGSYGLQPDSCDGPNDCRRISLLHRTPLSFPFPF